MPSPNKTIERVENLLRLAAPSSGTTEAERISAALEAAKIFSENNFSIQVKKPTKRPFSERKPKPRTGVPVSFYNHNSTYDPGSSTKSSNKWIRAIASFDCTCADGACQGEIAKGEPVWMRFNGYRFEYLHISAPCTEEYAEE